MNVEETNMTPAHDPEAVRLSAHDAYLKSCRAYRRAGHAIAVVETGGELIETALGSVDWSRGDEINDATGFVRHRTHFPDTPFVAFAGPCAEAMWRVKNGEDFTGIDEAVELLLTDGGWVGDTACQTYETRVELLNDHAMMLGFGQLDRTWERGWIYDLDVLWPAVCEVAEMFLRGEPVTHAKVKAALDRVG